MGKRMAAFLSAIIAIIIITAIVLADNSNATYKSTWPESIEFSQLESGQDRFSIHDTNVPDFKIIVDHQTGIEYLYGHDNGMAPLLTAQGEPLRVFEAG